MTKTEFIAYLREQVAVFGSQHRLAEHCGVADSYLSDVLTGRREPGQKLLDALGFRRVVTYERVREEAEEKE
jgi:transcriptional regulator with XRE-family HTH domain